MKKEAERLENLAEAANNKYNAYTGNDDNTKNSLKSAYESAKNKADKYNESLSETEKFLSEYLNVTFSELPGVKEEWNSINNAIKDNAESIKKLQRE